MKSVGGDVLRSVGILSVNKRHFSARGRSRSDQPDFQTIVSPLEFSGDASTMQKTIQSYVAGQLAPATFLREIMMYGWYAPKPPTVAMEDGEHIFLFTDENRLRGCGPVSTLPYQRLPGFVALFNAEQAVPIHLDDKPPNGFVLPRELAPVIREWCDTVDTECLLAELCRENASVKELLSREVRTRLQEYEYFVISRASEAGQNELIVLPENLNAPDMGVNDPPTAKRYVAAFTAVDTIDVFRSQWVHMEALTADSSAQIGQVTGEHLFKQLADEANSGYDGVVLNPLSPRGLQMIVTPSLIKEICADK